ncbi:TonB-dependent receptor [Chitinophaga silvatica]|uniref:TonB-dependent receptor n=1 Tax=Chitinophaga silvatica TaxID=2282649 RepID=A0A3E1YH18_9BACT|nr:TonB-dependent receptor [Chitinophaga silvatica]RFS26679.1 TonB-dependent receptor [Chitinophaga silvatica]
MRVFYLSLLFICISTTLFAQKQNIEITGIVSDTNNVPLAGANVVVKDRVGLGAITDEKGRYKIIVEPYHTLIFSYMGYISQEIPVRENHTINVTLRATNTNALEQVVITAVGPQKKVTVTGAITTVNPKDLRTPTANITNALAGNVAGVIAMQRSGEPGSNQSDFWIRGISTFGANSAAMVLVDGFERPFNEINIEDIESFSVLKDASATAIYGSRGANGVILVTTKKGKTGKINIDGKVEHTYSTRTRTPKFVDGNVYAALANEAKVTRNQEPFYTQNELEILKMGLDPDFYPNVNWQDQMLKDGANTERAALNINGGATIARFYVSGSYVQEGGMYKSDESLKEYKTNANLSRYNYRINLDLDVTKTTLFRIGVAGFLEKKNYPGLKDDIWYSLVGQSPVSIPVLYSNGLVPAYGTGNKTNPWVLATQTGFREYWRNKAETNFVLDQNLDFITPGLKATGRLAFDANNENNINRKKWPEQYFESKRNRNGIPILTRISPESQMFQETSAGGERVSVYELELRYARAFAQRHRIEAMGKYFQREQRQTVNLGSDIINGIPRRNQSLSGRLMYGYDNRYLAEFNFGYTGSENFKPGHQFGFFPAVSAAWNVSEEKFIKDNYSFIDLLKLRFSYGEVGNDNFGGNRFAYLSTISSGGTYNFGENISPNVFPGLYYSQVSSEQLTWEIARKQDLGLEVNLLRNLFSITIDLFKERRENIYTRRGYLPAMVGISSQPWANVGIMENKGFDAQFNVNKKIKAVEITMRGNITYFRNQVIAYDEEANNLKYRMTQGFRLDQAKGLIALGLFKDYEEIRNSPKQMFGPVQPGDIKYKDVNGDGIIDENDIVPIGSSRVPCLLYGVGMSVRWHGIDFNVHFQGSGKSSYFVDGPSVYPFADGSWGNILTDVAEPGNRWISKDISGDPATENPNAKYPRLSYGGNPNNYRASTFWLRNGAYLRLKNIELGYTLPQRITRWAHINNARLYLMGQNLAVWDYLKLWDPELASGNGMSYPLSKTITGGLTINF